MNVKSFFIQLYYFNGLLMGGELTLEKIKFYLFYFFIWEYGDRVRVGLTIAKAIIELHDGQIRIEKNKDNGTSVIFKIPDIKE